MKIYKENLTQDEFNSIQENMECELDGITHWANENNYPKIDGYIKQNYCYSEENNEEIWIYYEEFYNKNGEKLYNIYK